MAYNVDIFINIYILYSLKGWHRIKVDTAKIKSIKCITVCLEQLCIIKF